MVNSTEGTTEDFPVVPTALFISEHECRGSVLRTPPPAYCLSLLPELTADS